MGCSSCSIMLCWIIVRFAIVLPEFRYIIRLGWHIVQGIPNIILTLISCVIYLFCRQICSNRWIICQFLIDRRLLISVGTCHRIEGNGCGSLPNRHIHDRTIRSKRGTDLNRLDLLLVFGWNILVCCLNNLLVPLA